MDIYGDDIDSFFNEPGELNENIRENDIDENEQNENDGDNDGGKDDDGKADGIKVEPKKRTARKPQVRIDHKIWRNSTIPHFTTISVLFPNPNHSYV